MTGHLTIEGAAEYTDYKISYLYNLVSSNKIPFIKSGKKLWFNKEELHRWIRAGGPVTYDIRKFKRERF